MWPAVGIPRGTFSHGKGGATGHQRSGFGILNPKTGQRLKADLDALTDPKDTDDIPHATAIERHVDDLLFHAWQTPCVLIL